MAVYITRARISVHANGTTIIREGHGSGQAHGLSPGEVHDAALKAAETDATKRALATFGKPFGLALYGRGKNAPQSKIETDGAPQIVQTLQKPLLPPDDTTPIPRPSRYYGRRQDFVTKDRAEGKRLLESRTKADPSIVPTTEETFSNKIDKSTLAIGEPRRLRDKSHLRFVAGHSCLVCGRQPSDAHHLRFAQPRALGLKVSDEFTVPLCREHHNQLHQAGNEVAWWHNLNIKPLPIAKRLWDESHTTSKEEFTEHSINVLGDDSSSNETKIKS